MTIDPRHSSLIVVDAQRGFSELCPDELPVPGALTLIEPINRLLALPWLRIDATQDYHPADHCSFLGRRGDIYPPHCVIGTPGAEFLPGLHSDKFHAVWRKGFDRDVEAYAVTAQHPKFAEFLKASGVETVVICGVAANICCYFTGRDLLASGLRVVMAEDAMVGIDVPQAGLYQDKARAEGLALGMTYADVIETTSP